MNNSLANALASQVNKLDNAQLIELVGHYMEQARPVGSLIAALETCLSVVEEKAGHYRPAWLDTCYETLKEAKAQL